MKSQSASGDTEATIKVVRRMLQVVDNCDRAFAAIREPATEQEAEIVAAYQSAYQDILRVFESLGVTTVPTLGTEFDYQQHQAVMQKPSDEYEEGIVCEEFQKGFMLKDKLIRAAMVAVAA
jgi:molecular chaperone GrpE